MHLPLSKGYVAIVDDTDAARVLQHSWYAMKTPSGKVYAASRIGPFTVKRTGRKNGQRAVVLLHRFILGLSAGDPMVDHRDGDGLNNRRRNLRPCTNGENLFGARRADNKSGFVGVSKYGVGRRFRATIKIQGRATLVGCFDTAVEAARAYDAAARKLHGSFARLNFPRSVCG